MILATASIGIERIAPGIPHIQNQKPVRCSLMLCGFSYVVAGFSTFSILK
jgi:hypothetical protein